MTLGHKLQQKPHMLPAVQLVQNMGPGKYVNLDGLQSTSDVEAEMSEQAREKILVRKEMARLFQQ